MVHGVELTLVEHEDVVLVERHAVGHFAHLVDVDKRNLHTCRCVTQGLSARSGAVGRRADEVEDTGAVLLHEDGVATGILLAILVIYLIEEVLDEVREELRLLVVGRSQLIAEVGGREVELILDLGVVGHHEVVVEPLVEGCRGGTLIDGRDAGVEDRLGEVVVLTAGGNHQRG